MCCIISEVFQRKGKKKKCLLPGIAHLAETVKIASITSGYMQKRKWLTGLTRAEMQENILQDTAIYK